MQTTTQITFSFLLLLCSLGKVSALPGDAYWNQRPGAVAVDVAVQVIAIANRNVYVAGIFSKAGGVPAKNIARWDGNQWSSLGTGVTGGGFSVIALTALGGNLFAGGTFDKAGDIAAHNIARWDGSNWHPLGNGVNGIVRALAGADGKLYVGGSFSMAGDVPAANIAMWDGKKWSGLGAGLQGEAVDSLAANETSLYAGGRFWQGAGVQATNIAQWDGLGWRPLGRGIRVTEDFSEGAVVRALWLSGTNLYAGGGFRLAGEVRARNVARWDGFEWSPLLDGVSDPFGEVYAFAEASGTLFVGGGFFEVSGMPINYVASWDGLRWSSLGSGLSAEIGRAAAWALASDGAELFVGGGFNQAGGKPAMNFAIWSIPRTLKVESLSQNQLRVSWPAPDTNFVLEATSSLASEPWQPVLHEPALQGDRWTVTSAISGINEFFRLRAKGTVE